MYAATNGRPSVVLPSVCTWIRGDAFSSVWKYATTCFHSGSFRSVPGAKPITEAGVGTADAARCATDSAGVHGKAVARNVSAEKRRMRTKRGSWLRGLLLYADRQTFVRDYGAIATAPVTVY